MCLAVTVPKVAKSGPPGQAFRTGVFTYGVLTQNCTMPKLGYLCPIVKLFFLLMTFKKCLLSSPSSEETCYLDLQDDIIPDHYSSAVLSVCQNFLPISRTPNESESEEFVHCELQAAGWYVIMLIVHTASIQLL